MWASLTKHWFLTSLAFCFGLGFFFADRLHPLLQMSTPVTQIWEGILLLPIVGIMDSKRSRDVMTAMLTTIERPRARSITAGLKPARGAAATQAHRASLRAVGRGLDRRRRPLLEFIARSVEECRQPGPFRSASGLAGGVFH